MASGAQAGLRTLCRVLFGNRTPDAQTLIRWRSAVSGPGRGLAHRVLPGFVLWGGPPASLVSRAPSPVTWAWGPPTLPQLRSFSPSSSRPGSGMELFEEALQKWEQALSVGQRGDSSGTPTPGDSLRNPETASEVLSEVGGPLLWLSELPAGEKVGTEMQCDSLAFCRAVTGPGREFSPPPGCLSRQVTYST